MFSDQLNQIQDQFNTILRTEMALKIATIAAYVVGVVAFFFKSVQEWYTNGGRESIALLTMNVLRFINTVSESLYYSVEETVDKPREV